MTNTLIDLEAYQSTVRAKRERLGFVSSELG